MSYQEKQGNIIDYIGDKYICHQCNCQDIPMYNLKGLAYLLCNLPDSAIEREYQVPGNIQVCESKIIHLFAQNYLGRPKHYETEKQRREWFEQCLQKLKEFVQENNIDEVYFPYKIECGLARGNWDKYKQMLEAFALECNINVICINKD